MSLIQRMALLLGAAILIWACGGGESVPPAPVHQTDPSTPEEAIPEGEPEAGGQLNLRLDGSPGTLNPLFFTSMVESRLMGLLFDNLWAADFDMEAHPLLVESYEQSEDRLTFVVHLKKEARWQDGETFTAHDVVYSYQKILDDRVPATTYKESVSTITSLKALDDHTLEFVHKEPLATAVWNMTFPVVPKHLFQQHEGEDPSLKRSDWFAQYGRHPMGNGPYRIVDWKTDVSVTLERWKDYPFEPRGYVDRIHFRIIPDDSISLDAFRIGEIDEMQLLEIQWMEQTDDPQFQAIGRKLKDSTLGFTYIGWNMDGSNPFFTDLRVRQAMTMALDTPTILKAFYYDLREQARGPWHSRSWAYNPAVELLPFDPARSAELLDEAGWTDSDGDGVRDQGGRRFEFTILVPSGSATGMEIATAYKERLTKLGIVMEIRTLEWSVFIERVHNHDFEAEMAGWGAGVDPDLSWNLWHSTQYEQGRNYGKYANQRVDELFLQGRRTFGRENREPIYREIFKLIYEDQPYTFITYSNYLMALNKDLRGVRIAPRNPYGYYPGLLEWWIPREAQAQRAGTME